MILIDKKRLDKYIPKKYHNSVAIFYKGGEGEKGMVFRSTQLQDGWNIWHEVMDIDGDNITIANYGKTTPAEEVVFRKWELDCCFRKGILVMA